MSGQLGDDSAALHPVTADHHVVAQPIVELSHLAFLPEFQPKQGDFVGGSEEKRPEDDADWRQEQGIDQSPAIRDRHDIVVSDRGQRDEGEREDVEKTNVAVGVRGVAPTVTIEPA